jgi:hypothetical protein
MTLFLDFWKVMNDSFVLAEEILALKEILEIELEKDEVLYETHVDTSIKHINTISSHLRQRDDFPSHNMVTKIHRLGQRD